MVHIPRINLDSISPSSCPTSVVLSAFEMVCFPSCERARNCSLYLDSGAQMLTCQRRPGTWKSAPLNLCLMHTAHLRINPFHMYGENMAFPSSLLVFVPPANFTSLALSGPAKEEKWNKTGFFQKKRFCWHDTDLTWYPPSLALRCRQLRHVGWDHGERTIFSLPRWKRFI